MNSSSASGHEPKKKALVAHVKPKNFTGLDPTPSDSIGGAEIDDDIFEERTFEDPRTVRSRQGLMSSMISGDPTEIGEGGFEDFRSSSLPINEGSDGLGVFDDYDLNIWNEALDEFGVFHPRSGHDEGTMASLRANPVNDYNIGENRQAAAPVNEKERPDQLSPRNIRHVPSWDKLDHVAKAIVLKTLSDQLRSFQAACTVLSLEPNEVKSFLRRHDAQKERTAAWRRDVKEWAKAGKAPVDDNAREPPEPIYVERGSIARAIAYLEPLALKDLSKAVSAWSHRMTAWPLDIDYSDFNPLDLGMAPGNFPSVAPPPPPIPPKVTASLEDDCRVFVSFTAAERNGLVRISSILLPKGVIIVGPEGTKKLLFGGRYTISYPVTGTNIQDSDVDKFLICANYSPPFENVEQSQDDDIQVQPEQVSGQSTARRAASGGPRNEEGKGKEIASSGTPGTGAILGEDVAVERPFIDLTGEKPPGEVENHGEESPEELQGELHSRQDERPVGIHDGTGDSQEHRLEEFLNVPNEHGPESRNLLLPDSTALRGTEANLARRSNKGSGIFGYLTATANKAASQPSPVSPPRPPAVRFDNIIKHQQAELEEWAVSELETEESAVPMLNSSLGRNISKLKPKTSIPDGPTIQGMSLLEIPAVDPYPNPFHANENIFGPPQKQKLGDLVTLANEGSGRVLLQFRLPKGYEVCSPSGYSMNFDGPEQGPGDGTCPASSGVGGLYTVVLRDTAAADPPVPTGPLLPQIPELVDRVELRINLPERMAMFRNEQLLPRLTEAGIHEVSLVQTTQGDTMDLVCENGRYQIFRDMLPAADRECFLLGRRGDAMDIDELEEVDLVQLPGQSSSARPAQQQVGQAGNAAAGAQAEPMDVDGEEEEQAEPEPEPELDPIAEAQSILAPHRQWLDGEHAKEKKQDISALRRSLRAEEAQRQEIAEREAAAELARLQQEAEPVQSSRGRVAKRRAATRRPSMVVDNNDDSPSDGEYVDTSTLKKSSAQAEVLPTPHSLSSRGTASRRGSHLVPDSSVGEPANPLSTPQSRQNLGTGPSIPGASHGSIVPRKRTARISSVQHDGVGDGSSKQEEHRPKRLRTQTPDTKKAQAGTAAPSVANRARNPKGRAASPPQPRKRGRPRKDSSMESTPRAETTAQVGTTSNEDPTSSAALSLDGDRDAGDTDDETEEEIFNGIHARGKDLSAIGNRAISIASAQHMPAQDEGEATDPDETEVEDQDS